MAASRYRPPRRHASALSRLVDPLARLALTCLIVAALSYWIQGIEMARGLHEWKPAQEANANPLEWIRTQDGWERSLVLQPPSREQGVVHPLVVAGLQLLGSLMVLLAFPRSSSLATLADVARAPRAWLKQ